MICSFAFIFIIILLNRAVVEAACPNLCNRNGQCTDDNECYCFEGYFGADCSKSTLI